MLGEREYRQIWRIVDGAVRDALDAHPDYLTDKGKRAARASIVKRVSGNIYGYVEQSTRGRSGVSPAVETVRTPASVFSRAWVYVRSKVLTDATVSRILGAFR